MPVVASQYKPWMLFVDGENLTIRAQKRAEKMSKDISTLAKLYRQDVFFWPQNIPVTEHRWTEKVHQASQAERCYYYTSMPANDDAMNAAQDELIECGFSPVILKKRDGRSKGVDISLTKDVLVNAFQNNYDIAVLVSGDGDYVPVVEEVKRFGKRVVLAFFGKGDGLSPALRRAADEFWSLDNLIKS